MKTPLFSSVIVLIGLGIVSLTQTNKLPTLSKVNKQVNEQFGFVPSGLAKLDADTVSVQSFLVSKTEVTNLEYRLFLNDLIANGEQEKYAIAQIDSFNWSKGKAFNKKYVDYYHSHPAYRDYPVVNISKEGAQLYCEWLTEKYNELLPPDQRVTFRLPLKAEWVRAACGDNLNASYTWGGTYVRNSQGQILANFVRIGETSIARDEKGEFVVKPVYPDINDLEDLADIIAPAKSYFQNGFGIYNMNGNVAEMLKDQNEVIGGSWYDAAYDIRNQSTKGYTGSSSTVGFRVVATVNPSELTWFKPKN